MSVSRAECQWKFHRSGKLSMAIEIHRMRKNPNIIEQVYIFCYAGIGRKSVLYSQLFSPKKSFSSRWRNKTTRKQRRIRADVSIIHVLPDHCKHGYDRGRGDIVVLAWAWDNDVDAPFEVFNSCMTSMFDNRSDSNRFPSFFINSTALQDNKFGGHDHRLWMSKQNKKVGELRGGIGAISKVLAPPFRKPWSSLPKPEPFSQEMHLKIPL
jgi:hypothetical protein